MHERLLIIEDDEFFSNILEKHFQRNHNFQCDMAFSIDQAEKLLELGNQYFAAIVDLELPGSEIGAGLGLTSQYAIPSIIFTGNEDPDIYEKFSTSTLIDFVNKSGAASVRYVSKLLERVYCNQFLTVLVVDDSRSALQSLGALLKNNGFNVITASSGEDCIDKLSASPDLVILDQFLPDIMGYELCAKVKKINKNPHCQIIGVSSKKDRQLSSKFLKNFGNDFIYRPFDPEEFCNRINQRAELIDHIRELERLSEEKNKFLAMAVHDLRNPLSAIQLASRRIAKVTNEYDHIEQPLSMISNSAEGMQLLINDLLDISAIESGRFELNKIALNLSDIVHESILSFTDKADSKNISIVTDVPDSTMIEIDAVRMRQVVDNLVSNAIKYSPHDKSVNVTLEKTVNKIILGVEDQGPGIDKEHLDQLFVAFKRLGHATTGGESSHGLGLSICHKIIAAHNGKIKYKDAANGGSYFFIELPIG